MSAPVEKTIADRLDELGFGRPGNNIDAVLHAALDQLRRFYRLHGIPTYPPPRAGRL